MFVSVRYGDNCNVILNTDCSLQSFRNCLREKCNVSENHNTIDLADEFGIVQNLSNMKKDPQERVDSILKTRLRYVLIELKKEKSGIIVESLLKNWVPREREEGGVEKIMEKTMNVNKKARKVSVASYGSYLK